LGMNGKIRIIQGPACEIRIEKGYVE